MSGTRIVVAATFASLIAVLGCAAAGASGSVPRATGVRTTPVALPASMAALGDSITQAYDATPTKHLLVDQPQLSWSTGYAGAKVVNSQYERLLSAGDSALKTKGHSANYSVTGAKMSALSGQAAQAVRMKASYVTILMGANDACTSTIDGMTPVATFKTEFTSSLTELQKIKGGTSSSPRSRTCTTSGSCSTRTWRPSRSGSSGSASRCSRRRTTTPTARRCSRV